MPRDRQTDPLPRYLTKAAFTRLETIEDVVKALFSKQLGPLSDVPEGISFKEMSFETDPNADSVYDSSSVSGVER